MVSRRAVRIALGHPSLVVDVLRGRSLQEIDARIHSSPYWPSELRRAVFKEIDKVNEMFLRNSSTEERDASGFIRDTVIPVAREFADSEFSMPSHAALYLLCRGMKPRVVVETGTYWGISTSVILRALHENNIGTLYSIDLPNGAYTTDSGEVHAEKLPEGTPTGAAVPDFLKDKWNLVLGDAAETLVPLLAKVGQIDLFFHDSKHTYSHMLWECQQVWPYLKKEGILAVHDIDWNSAFDDFQKEVVATAWKLPGFGIIAKT